MCVFRLLLKWQNLILYVITVSSQRVYLIQCLLNMLIFVCELLLECIHIYSSKLVPHGFNAFNFIYLVLYLVSWEGWSSLCFSFTFKIIVFNRLCPNLYLLISEMIKYQCSTAYYIRLTTIPAGSLATHLTYLEKSGFTSIYTSLWKVPQRKYVKIFF